MVFKKKPDLRIFYNVKCNRLNFIGNFVFAGVYMIPSCIKQIRQPVMQTDSYAMIS